VLQRIADAAGASPSDRVVEIGPGRGALTEVLRPRVGSLVLVELDRALAEMQRERYARDAAVRVVEADVLDVPLGELGGDDFVLIGNVPYYITTPILFHTLAGALPRRAVFLVQREVAERATAAPGSHEYGALTVNLQALTRVEHLFDVPPSAFRPPPKVHSAVIRLTPLGTPLVSADERRPFRTFVQALFGQRRKQLGTSLRALVAQGGDAGSAEVARAALERMGIDPTTRPERLSPEEFIGLFRAVRNAPLPDAPNG
jgi:16S rRNA (adenine1518-N6/adenine1519-N6)-dimethyltransferase